MKYRGIGMPMTSIHRWSWTRCLLSPSGAFPSTSSWAFRRTLQCAPRQPIPQPVARSVSVKVPYLCTPLALPPYPCAEVRYRPSRALPVRVDIAVRPEARLRSAAPGARCHIAAPGSLDQ